MSDTISDTFAVIRDKFHNIAVLGGPQYAAILRICGLEGRLYVSEYCQWLWIPQSGLDPRILTAQELEDLVSPIEVCRTLLLSAEYTMIHLLHGMDCVLEHVLRERTVWKEPGSSRADLIISELFRLQVQSGFPKYVM